MQGGPVPQRIKVLKLRFPQDSGEMGSRGSRGSWARVLCVVLCFWGTVGETRLHTVGPCMVNATTASFDCSGRKLAHIPAGIWDNVSTLDLSHNNLDLTEPRHLSRLQKFHRLLVLNLTGNYLPLLESGRLGSLPTLLILDLSSCQLTSVEAGALRGLPRLQKLILGDNPLQAPRRDAALDLRGNPQLWLTGINRVSWPEGSKVEAQGKLSQGGNHLHIHRQFHRKLLGDLLENTTPNQTTRNDTSESQQSPSHSWQYLVAVLVAAISVSIVIAVLAKCQLLRSYLASYRHTRLLEGDTVSQGDPAGLEVGFSMHQGHARNTHSAPLPQGEMGEHEEDDDDGFIEDNYIQASERERAQRAAEELVETEEEEEMDEIEFTIG